MPDPAVLADLVSRALFPGAPFWLLLVPSILAWRYANSEGE